ncbi:MAG TPA: FAD-linked oxidase C-terminal domain-containing protein [bacterium]|jgi:glycolate oxidase
MYNAVTDKIKQGLVDISGRDFVAYTPEVLEKFASDETEDLKFLPEVVIWPGTVEEISEIMKLANREKIPVTPRGGGTGLSGGALPVHKGIVLGLRRFTNVLEIDKENLFAVVETGVITETFQNMVEAEGLFYPPDPASRGSCFIGGNIAENSGGPRAVKYGVTKDWIYGLEVVLPTGEIIRPGGKLLKNVSGYNLTQLIIGSEGTLGIATKAIVRLISKPKFRSVLLATFNDPHTACKIVPRLFHAGITPSACEFMERDAIKMAEVHLEKEWPDSDAAAQLLIEIDGNDEEKVNEQIETVGMMCDENGARDVLLAETGQKVENLWALRRSIGEAVKSKSIYKEEDTVVPRAQLADLFVGVKEICKTGGIRSVCYGHAGDGNLHVNLLKENLSDEEWNTKLHPLIVEIFELTVKLGGTISGEHGIGWTQKDYLPIAVPEADLNVMRKLKKLFDPNYILNPGKMFAI